VNQRDPSGREGEGGTGGLAAGFSISGILDAIGSAIGRTIARIFVRKAVQTAEEELAKEVVSKTMAQLLRQGVAVDSFSVDTGGTGPTFNSSTGARGAGNGMTTTVNFEVRQVDETAKRGARQIFKSLEERFPCPE
jgi:hypothetical protein